MSGLTDQRESHAPERLVVSVVSTGRPELVRAFLRSLYSTAPDDVDTQVIVTFNVPLGDAEDHVRSDAVSAGWADRVQVATNNDPRGFAENHNRAICERTADYYLVANDDVVVLDGAIDGLIRVLRDPEHSTVAVASPNLLNEDLTTQGSTYSFPSLFRVLAATAELRANRVLRWVITRAARRVAPGRSREWAHDRSMDVDSVRGAFALVRRDAIDQCGLMDEIALVGGEDLEWHRRMAESGWTVRFVHDASVVHLGSQTVGGDPLLRVEYVKGWLNYFQKHGRRRDVVGIRGGVCVVFVTRWVMGLLRRDEVLRRAAIRGLGVVLHWPRLWRAARDAGRISPTCQRAGAQVLP